MLTEGQKNYLARLTKERLENIVNVFPYNPKTEAIAEKVMNQIKEVIPKADVRYMGASALKISGQNDVDIYIMTPNNVKEDYLSKLSVKFAEQNKKKWQWHDDGIEVSVYLSDPEDFKFKEQIAIFEIFKTKPEITKGYEVLKELMNGKSYGEYQKAKYEFYNRVLGTKV